MKTLLILCGILAAVNLPAADGGLVARPATQAEVNAGTVRSKFVSPATLAGWTGGGGGPTNGQTALQVTNIATAVAKEQIAISNLTLIARERYINVLDYGAIPDGVTTNTTAFNAALAAGGVSNLPVRIPSGAYVVGTLNWPTTNVHFFGDGPSSIIRPKSGAANNVFSGLAVSPGAILHDFWYAGDLKGGTNNTFSTNATPPTTQQGLIHNADGPGAVFNVRVSGVFKGLEITGTSDILGRYQRAFYYNIDITNCTIGVVTAGPNNSEYTKLLNLSLVNNWGGWSNAGGANMDWIGGTIRESRGFTMWAKGPPTNRMHFAVRSFKFNHGGPIILESANNCTFDGGEVILGVVGAAEVVASDITFDACTNSLFKNVNFQPLNGISSTLARYTNGGVWSGFEECRIWPNGGTNIIGADTNNSIGRNLVNDNDGRVIVAAANWGGMSRQGVITGNGAGLTSLNASELGSGIAPSNRFVNIIATNINAATLNTGPATNTTLRATSISTSGNTIVGSYMLASSGMGLGTAGASINFSRNLGAEGSGVIAIGYDGGSTMTRLKVAGSEALFQGSVTATNGFISPPLACTTATTNWSGQGLIVAHTNTVVVMSVTGQEGKRFRASRSPLNNSIAGEAILYCTNGSFYVPGSHAFSTNLTLSYQENLGFFCYGTNFVLEY